MGKIGIKKIGALVLTVATLSSFAGCTFDRNGDGRTGGRDTDRVEDLTGDRDGDRGEPSKQVKLYTDSWVMEQYITTITDYDKVEYEQVVFTYGLTDGLGPHESRYRGIVYLTADEAKRLKEEYEWTETDKPEFEFDEVDDSVLGEGPWYKSDAFCKDNFKTLSVYYAVFDGEHLVFDVHQT
jgi:hypothetical protein